VVILRGFALGLSTGIFCLGYCYPALAPVLLSRREAGWWRTASSLALFLAGRLAAYLLFGVLAGLAGPRLLNSPAFQAWVLPILFLAIGALLVLYGAVTGLPRLRICALGSPFFSDRRFLLLLGFLAGVNLCPPFLLAIGYALELGGIAESVLFFLFFFMATSLFLLPFLLSWLLARFQSVRAAARIAAIIAGLWFAYLGLRRLF
jgi:sulfite exporter TauE/SafE